jgi:hypothetical protein
MSSLRIMWVEVGERGWSESIDEVGWRSKVERSTFDGSNHSWSRTQKIGLSSLS